MCQARHHALFKVRRSTIIAKSRVINRSITTLGKIRPSNFSGTSNKQTLGAVRPQEPFSPWPQIQLTGSSHTLTTVGFMLRLLYGTLSVQDRIYRSKPRSISLASAAPRCRSSRRLVLRGKKKPSNVIDSLKETANKAVDNFKNWSQDLGDQAESLKNSLIGKAENAKNVLKRM